jgi:hypothetical protein
MEDKEDKAPGDFYLVWREKGAVPVVKHASFCAAQDEAERVARLHPGEKIYVLSVMGAYEAPKPEPAWRWSDYIEHVMNAPLPGQSGTIEITTNVL